MNNKISIFNIFIIFCFSIPFVLLLLTNKITSLLLPYSFALFLTFLIAILIGSLSKDKFYVDIYILTVLFHLVFGLFIQILKYDLLSLQTINGFACIGIDNDGIIYHSQAIGMLEHNESDVLFYSNIVYWIYKYIIRDFRDSISSKFCISIIVP